MKFIVVRFVVLFLFLSLTANAHLVLWTPVGQNLTYVLPEGVTPALYIENMKNSRALSHFIDGLRYSERDQVRNWDSKATTEAAGIERALLVANKVEDHSSEHPRIDNFGRHFPETFVFPIGAALKLNVSNEEKFYQELTQHFGLFVFMGGDDKDPGLSGEKKTWSLEINRTRDILEQRLIRYVYYKSSRKIFGVCRGLQQVFTSLGGKLFQDINKELPIKESHVGGTLHSIQLLQTKNKILSSVIANLPQDFVDSHHHQAAREESVKGTVFEVSAKSPEGIIEALESRDGRIFLVQFHPEMLDNLIDFTNGFFKKMRQWASVQMAPFCQKLF